jgi:hypothetical protein
MPGNAAVMGRTALLQEQSTLLRALADSFDIPSIREDLLALAEECDRLTRPPEDRQAEQ